MAYLLIIKEPALEDTRNAYKYYEDITPGLGDRFLAQLHAAYTSISQYPESFAFIDDKKILRDKLLKVFPFTIIYTIEKNVVVVIAVHNCYQHPGKRYRNR